MLGIEIDFFSALTSVTPLMLPEDSPPPRSISFSSQIRLIFRYVNIHLHSLHCTRIMPRLGFLFKNLSLRPR
ncbi:hypothetical protein Leryth_021682 [Lithospermum erythrorhizon]|nr:hypothetical protein Leryth_021682 [Lithospermum erythrorhizon]